MQCIFILFNFDSFPFKTSAIKSNVSSLSHSPTSRSVHLFIVYENAVVETAELVEDSWIFLVYEVLVHVFEFEFIHHVGNEYQVNDTELVVIYFS
jgi:hypothetical protein